MDPVASPSDEQVFADMAGGDSAALEELYRRHARGLYAFCVHTTRADLAVDLVQDTFMRAVKSSHRFKPEKGSVRAWLYTIARNLCIDRLRARKENPGLPPEGVAGNQGRTEDAALREEALQAVRDCVNALERTYVCEALLLYHMSGKVYREIGEILGRSTSRARDLVMEAQASVRRCLENKGIDALA